MAVRGRHRRHQPNRINRASLTVTAGGAGMAIPLIGTGTAHAADVETWNKAAACESGNDCGDRGGDTSGTGTASSPQGNRKRDVKDVRPETTPQSGAGTAEMYTVVRGDTLSGIAEARQVRGGWQRLYAVNRRTVGSDPNLIIPGQRLSLRVSATPGTDDAHVSSKQDKSKDSDGRSDDRTSEATSEAPSQAANGSDTRAGTGTKHETRRLAAPVAASPSTPYRAAGGSWSKGYHTGVDFPVPTGTSVKAVAAGRVVSAGWGGAYGYQVVIRHADGKYSQYAHLSALTVKAGQNVVSGQRIARSGSTGNSTGPHLHFEVRTGPGFGSDIDPLAYLRAGGVTI
ncbi:M23 family metallopeptidase [Streptomyces jeddahensis]|uniref:Murein DD-endopeptidase MepM n=1 Tax=Streptomyces jeddahensis TaxID=1716141 RepID=A0A177I0J8_9ACTN|nr:M23 family metallopeptidase [Streptomyces jeddahensis]OAH16349.1 murein DD-endopeptidase MepM [Streptomyces jeddahensis]